MSSTQDTTAFVLTFPDADGRLAVLPFVFLPKDSAAGRLRRQKRDKAPYLAWAEQGHLILTEGNVVDYDVVYETIMEQAERYDIREIQADPYNASGLLERLQKAGLTVTTVRQGWSLAEATKETERLILARELTHPDHPVLNWQMSNVAVHEDRHGNLWPIKDRSAGRIDAAVAMVMAINGARFGLGRESGGEVNYYNDNPLIVLE